MIRRIELDRFYCKGCGACEEIAPQTFRMDEAGEKADLVTETADTVEAVEMAAAMCPVKCIEINTEEENEST